ncbi:hypothetical protein HMPREF1147_0038 [Selenomonas sp. FOBRC9]|nr:hypothetical protein HMPREF1147_0038 [Selenomonas sp. FOBRC9]
MLYTTCEVRTCYMKTIRCSELSKNEIHMQQNSIFMTTI